MVMMAESNEVKSGPSRRELSRLQRRAPASLKINREMDWKAAIPLLSPLVTSPERIDFVSSGKDDVRKNNGNGNNINNKAAAAAAVGGGGGSEGGKEAAAAASTAVVFKKWQHPAAPFCYEPAPLVPFVCSGSVDR